MNLDNFISLIENTPKYKKLDLSFHFNNIDYKIDGEYYKIHFYSNYNKFFLYVNLDRDLKDINIGMKKILLTEEKLLKKFDLLIRSIKKAHYITTKKEIHNYKLREKISDFILKEYGVNFEKSDNRKCYIKLKNKSYKNSNDYYSYTKIDPTKEVIKKFVFEYKIIINFEDKDKNIIICDLEYANSKLILKHIHYHYKNKNITKIIRSEKLKNIMND